LSKAHIRAAVGNVVNADGVSSATSKLKAEVLKGLFEKVHIPDLGKPLPELLGRLPEKHMAPFVLESKEVEAALKQLDQNKAAAPDELHPAILRPIADIIADALDQLFNPSLASATLPAVWTTAEVVSIHKGGSRAAASNYRPVSLLSVILKTYERLLRGRYNTQHTTVELPGSRNTMGTTSSQVQEPGRPLTEA
uniref:Reverse transcriptase domain-containing protein n=1 Tax=Echinostoma caproni TaxID=27848 RepID=A0A183B843_9TREM